MAKMNVAGLEYVATCIETAALAHKDIGFNMGYVITTAGGFADDKSGHGCGTVACIAGWTLALLDEKGKPRKKPLSPSSLYRLFEGAYDPVRDARMRLGLTIDQADQLMTPAPFGQPICNTRWMRGIPLLEAVEAIRGLIDTGEVKWKE